MLSDSEILPSGAAVGGVGGVGGVGLGGGGLLVGWERKLWALPTLCWGARSRFATPWDSGKRGSG
jgi:hypothetical protein